MEPEFKNQRFPAMETLCLEIPLYQLYKATDPGDILRWRGLELYENTLDAYCLECEKESIFDLVSRKNLREISIEKKGACTAVKYKCQRTDCVQVLWFIFHNPKGGKEIQKIGQYPSLADLASADLQKYRKILGNLYAEFNRAIGLFTHGIGIGSFVYLRRIFESLIDEAHNQAKSTPGWDEDKYQKERMAEKVKRLKDYVPSTLVEYKPLYPILSRGIHDLSEEECYRFFPAVRAGIELILDQKIEQKEKALKEEEVRKALEDIQ
ncbi:short-chain dehydrogenase [Gemmatimonadota bacterium]